MASSGPLSRSPDCDAETVIPARNTAPPAGWNDRSGPAPDTDRGNCRRINVYYRMIRCPPMSRTIGFVGIGQLGFPIASTLLEAGYDVIAFDKREEAVDELEELGGQAADSPFEVARRAGSVHVVVVTDDQVLDVVTGDDGIAAGVAHRDGEGTVVIHSTVVPDTVRRVDEETSGGVSVLDVAVSGGLPRAREGDLTLMVGGEGTAVDGYGDVLDAIGRETHHLGDLGNGMATKLLNNAVKHAQEYATFEAVEFGKEYGLDEDQLIEVFKGGTASNSAVHRWDYITREYYETHPRGPRGGIENTKKNMNQMLTMAHDADVDVPMAGLVSQLAPSMNRAFVDRLLEE